jgi:hypothetical protein
MRRILLVLAVFAAACGQEEPPPASDAPSNAGATFVLESEALVGLWSFDRSCGLFDLDFRADGGATYYDYSDDMVRTHTGTWAMGDNNRVVLTTRVQGADGALGADTTIYNLDVGATVTDDLVAHLARADGGEARDINAKRCDEVEDRD